MGINRVGERIKNNKQEWMEIIKYNAYSDILVAFDSGYITKTNYSHFKNGSVLNPYRKSFYTVGYLGHGAYSSSIAGKKTKSFLSWDYMMRRCYSNRHKYRFYFHCTVCNEWHNYQIFAKWFDENYYQIGNKTSHLDKDLLYKGNKTYCPDKCVFIPAEINSLITTRYSERGEYPIGVFKHPINNNFVAHCNNGTGKLKHIGCFSSPEDAFYAYKEFKENYIKTVARKYYKLIPQSAYNALINWTVEITD